jgi:phosphopantetheinyl transferase
MPLLRTIRPFSDAVFGIWEVTESEAFFRADLPLTSAESEELSPLKGRRRMEWLGVRWLLHHLSESSVRIPLSKDLFSKPFFPDDQRLLCSLSHSAGIAGALLAEGDYRVGCDLQVVVEKMMRIAPRFLHSGERAFVEAQEPGQRLCLQHIFWTAKESIFKAYGLAALDFREDIRVEILAWDGTSGSGRGVIQKNGWGLVFDLWFERLDFSDVASLIWTVCRERPT